MSILAKIVAPLWQREAADQIKAASDKIHPLYRKIHDEHAKNQDRIDIEFRKKIDEVARMEASIASMKTPAQLKYEKLASEEEITQQTGQPALQSINTAAYMSAHQYAGLSHSAQAALGQAGSSTSLQHGGLTLAGTGTATLYTGPTITTSASTTGLTNMGMGTSQVAAGYPNPLGLGSSKKNVFFSLLRGIEEKAQFKNEETHPYDAAAFSIQDIRNFDDRVSLRGLLSFCISNSLEQIDEIVAVLEHYGIKVE